MSVLPVIGGRADDRKIVPAAKKPIESSPGRSLASRIAWRSEPGPESAVLVTSNVGCRTGDESTARAAFVLVTVPTELLTTTEYTPACTICTFVKTRVAFVAPVMFVPLTRH